MLATLFDDTFKILFHNQILILLFLHLLSLFDRTHFDCLFLLLMLPFLQALLSDLLLVILAVDDYLDVLLFPTEIE